jgi:hypothetical protein
MEAQIAEYGSFDYLSQWTQQEVIDGVRAVDSVEGGWEWLKHFVVNPNEGFMFTSNPTLSAIGSKMTTGHSGSSFAGTMRHLHYIAKHGLAAHRIHMLWAIDWTTPPGPLNAYYSDGLAIEAYERFIHGMPDRDLEIYTRLLPDRLRQVYPREEDAETRAGRMDVFDAAVRTRPQQHS